MSARAPAVAAHLNLVVPVPAARCDGAVAGEVVLHPPEGRAGWEREVHPGRIQPSGHVPDQVVGPAVGGAFRRVGAPPPELGHRARRKRVVGLEVRPRGVWRSDQCRTGGPVRWPAHDSYRVQLRGLQRGYRAGGQRIEMAPQHGPADGVPDACGDPLFSQLVGLAAKRDSAAAQLGRYAVGNGGQPPISKTHDPPFAPVGPSAERSEVHQTQTGGRVAVAGVKIDRVIVTLNGGDEQARAAVVDEGCHRQRDAVVVEGDPPAPSGAGAVPVQPQTLAVRDQELPPSSFAAWSQNRITQFAQREVRRCVHRHRDRRSVLVRGYLHRQLERAVLGDLGGRVREIGELHAAGGRPGSDNPRGCPECGDPAWTIGAVYDHLEASVALDGQPRRGRPGGADLIPSLVACHERLLSGPVTPSASHGSNSSRKRTTVACSYSSRG